MFNGIVAGTFLSAVILCPFLILFAIVIKNKQRTFNIYNRYNGTCLASGFHYPEDAERWLREYFIDEFSYQSCRCDFVIDEAFGQKPIIEDYCFDDEEVIEEIKEEDYTPVTPYYKNRIAKYFENVK